eukprot:1235394-Rhodomonas_salina.5
MPVVWRLEVQRRRAQSRRASIGRVHRGSCLMAATPLSLLPLLSSSSHSPSCRCSLARSLARFLSPAHITAATTMAFF